MSFPPFADLGWRVNDLLRLPDARRRFLLQCFQYLKERAANPRPGCGLPLDRRPYTLAAKYAVLTALHAAVCETEEPINPAPWQGLCPRTPGYRHAVMWLDLLTAAGAPRDGSYRLEWCQLRAEDRPGLESFLADVTADLRTLPECNEAPVDEATALPAMLSAPDLARQLGLPVPRVESALRRFRPDHPDCCVEVQNKRQNEAKYLYRTTDVLPVLQRLAKDG
ncbi:MAG TPA: hypothetical protein VKA46_40785 [Gemmataceae bacterium]|nr:hypothetical protein [Gemmataceae bacterium]